MQVPATKLGKTLFRLVLWIGELAATGFPVGLPSFKSQTRTTESGPGSGLAQSSRWGAPPAPSFERHSKEWKPNGRLPLAS